jgi:hypothetical protein
MCQVIAYLFGRVLIVPIATSVQHASMLLNLVDPRGIMDKLIHLVANSKRSRNHSSSPDAFSQRPALQAAVLTSITIRASTKIKRRNHAQLGREFSFWRQLRAARRFTRLDTLKYLIGNL